MKQIIIEAKDGKFLTQAATDINIHKRIIAKKVAIGKNDSADNWCEISAKEAQEFERQLKQAMQDDIDSK